MTDWVAMEANEGCESVPELPELGYDRHTVRRTESNEENLRLEITYGIRFQTLEPRHYQNQWRISP